MSTDEELLADSERLDKAYAEAYEHDMRHHDIYVKGNFNKLTRRTNFPKLGYFIHLLNEHGIACIIHGESAHAPMLWVEKDYYNAAYDLTIGNDELDEIDDEDPQFNKYNSTQPDTDFYP
jgi:hypothetical protein